MTSVEDIRDGGESPLTRGGSDTATTVGATRASGAATAGDLDAGPAAAHRATTPVNLASEPETGGAVHAQ